MVARSRPNQTRFLRYSHTVGLSAMSGRGFYYPVSTAIGRDGKIYTLSRSLEGDPRGVRVTIAGLDSEYYGVFGSYGEKDGEMVWPTAIAIGSDDRFYIADEFTNLISVFDSSGEFSNRWGTSGTGEGQFDGPSGLAFDSEGLLLVVDHQNHRVQRYTTAGEFVSSFGTRGNNQGEFDLPWGVDVGHDGAVYVADWQNDRVQKFSPDGEFMRTYGSSGQGDGEFSKPADVTVDEEGYIYVADWANQRVQVLDTDSGFVTKLRGEATPSKWAEEFLNINIEEAAAREKSDLEPDVPWTKGDPHEESWHIEKLFWAPTCVTLDSDGRLYVTESNRHRVQIYEKTR
jgi:tripartite motif-containing protein 71